MPANYLVTGPPRSGKTTVVRRVIDRLEADGHTVGGIVCPEVRRDGERVGFEIVDLMTGDRRVLAHIDRTAGPAVGKYRVDVPTLDAVCRAAFRAALDRADLVAIDEIAPMELHSDAFLDGVRRAFDADRPVLAAIHYESTAGLIGEVKRRADVDRFEVTDATRDDLPGTLTPRLLAAIERSRR